MTTTVTERYEVQAHLEIRKGHPKWSRVALTAINGWWHYVDHEHRCRSGFSGAHTYTDSLAFEHLEYAKVAMEFFATFPQQYDLRVVKTLYVISEEVAIGPQSPMRRESPPRRDYSFGWPRPMPFPPSPLASDGALK